MHIRKTGSDIVRWNPMQMFWPEQEYILPQATIESVHEQERLSGYKLLIDNAAILRLCKWQGEDRGSVLIYNTGRIGDQLWMTALVHEMKRLHPRLEIDVVSEIECEILWRENTDIRSVRLAPLPATGLQSYDYVLFFDETVAQQKTRNQWDCYEALFQEAGLRVLETIKPFVRPLHSHEVSSYHALLQPDAEGLVWRTRGHFVIGLHSSSRVRNLPEETLLQFIGGLAQSVPQKIYCLSYDDIGAHLCERLPMLPNIIPVHRRLNLLQIAALCRYASCVISPDSMLIHLAASQDAPTVALMSTVPPRYRTDRYPFCVPIYNPKACHYGDCFYKRPTFQFQLGEISEQAKCYTPTRTECDIIKSVTPEQIFEAMKIAITRKNERGGYDQSDLPTE